MRTGSTQTCSGERKTTSHDQKRIAWIENWKTENLRKKLIITLHRARWDAPVFHCIFKQIRTLYIEKSIILSRPSPGIQLRLWSNYLHTYMIFKIIIIITIPTVIWKKVLDTHIPAENIKKKSYNFWNRIVFQWNP